MKRITPDPQTRLGHCCGCKTDGVLFKIPGIYRYRCAPCFHKETGQHHWAAVPGTAPAIITNQTVREALAEENAAR